MQDSHNLYVYRKWQSQGSQNISVNITSNHKNVALVQSCFNQIS